MEKDALWHRSTLAARQGCILLPVSQGVDLGWKLDAMCGWALDMGSRYVKWETSAGRAGWNGVGLDNKLAGCGLQDVGDSTLEKTSMHGNDLQRGSPLQTLAGCSDFERERT